MSRLGRSERMLIQIADDVCGLPSAPSGQSTSWGHRTQGGAPPGVGACPGLYSFAPLGLKSPNSLDRMTRSAVAPWFHAARPCRAPRHRSALRSAGAAPSSTPCGLRSRSFPCLHSFVSKPSRQGNGDKGIGGSDAGFRPPEAGVPNKPAPVQRRSSLLVQFERRWPGVPERER